MILLKAKGLFGAKHVQNNPPQQVLSVIHLGRLKVGIKKFLKEEMEEIDELVKRGILG